MNRGEQGTTADPLGELIAGERRGGELFVAWFRLAILLVFVPALYLLRFVTGYLLPAYWLFSVSKWALMTLAAGGLVWLLRRGIYRPWFGFVTLAADVLFVTASIVTLSYHTTRHPGMLQDPLIVMFYLICLSGGVRAGLRYVVAGLPLCCAAVVGLALADGAAHGVALDAIVVTDRLVMLTLVAAMGLVLQRRMQSYLFDRLQQGRRHLREIASLLAIGHRLSSRDELERALDDIRTEATTLLRADEARIDLAREAGGEEVAPAGRRGPSGHRAEQPVVVDGAVAGTLSVTRRRGGPFDEHDRTLLTLLAAQAAIALRHAGLLDRIASESAWAPPDPAAAASFQGIIGGTPCMQRLYQVIDKAAPAAIPVLIRGESGTGKELVAAAIQARGDRRDRPFVALNCAAIPAALLESELFGHERGAFTGADRLRRGAFERAAGGTIFLDEIGDMEAPLQAKLLRVLQSGTFERLGGEATQRVDVRLITATNQDLAARIRRGEFREDLYYRINGLAITVPPLRERREDIPLLVEHFVSRYVKSGSPAPRFTVAALRFLSSRPWRGNVRELENLVHRTVVMCGGETVSERDVRALLEGPDTAGRADFHEALRRYTEERVREGCRLDEEADRLEREFLAAALDQAGGSVRKAAAQLGIPKSTLFNRMQKHRVGGE